MNLRLGAVPDAGAFDPEAEGFVSLREPRDSTLLVASIPVSAVIFVLLASPKSLPPKRAAFDKGSFRKLPSRHASSGAEDTEE